MAVRTTTKLRSTKAAQTFWSDERDDLPVDDVANCWSSSGGLLAHLVRQARYDSGPSPSNACMTSHGKCDDNKEYIRSRDGWSGQMFPTESVAVIRRQSVSAVYGPHAQRPTRCHCNEDVRFCMFVECRAQRRVGPLLYVSLAG